MTAQKKLEQLTDSWYGFTFFAAIISLLSNGIGIFTLIFTIGSTLFSLFINYLIGRSLQKRNGLTRVVLIVLSACFGVLGVLKLGGAFLGDWSFGGLLQIVLAVAGIVMNVRSFRVLTDRTVKTYFA
jgi:hypothetical protein